MEIKTYIPRTEAWKIRKATEAEEIFRQQNLGYLHELHGVSVMPRETIMEIIDGEITIIGLGEREAWDVREEVALAIQEGPEFNQDHMLISYGYGEVAYL